MMEEVTQEFSRDPHQHATKVANKLEINISAKHFRKIIYARTPLKYFRSVQKIARKETRRVKRLQYALDLQHWTNEDWQSVTFVDEKVFSSASDGKSS